jgi:hypothetical protein
MIDKAREAFEKAVLGKYQEPFIKMNNGQYLCLTQELDFRLFKAGQASRDAFLREYEALLSKLVDRAISEQDVRGADVGIEKLKAIKEALDDK